MKAIAPLHAIVVALACLAAAPSATRAADHDGASPEPKPALPRLVDLGAGRCLPCRMMKPILDELKRDYATQFETVFIDVGENRDEAKRYGIKLIPTQIFYNAAGRELFRHEGFMAKPDILTKWRELGVVVQPPAAPTSAGG